jgi:hypothetical protein
MPTKSNEDFLLNKETYSFQKVGGILSLMVKDVIFENQVAAGDTVSVFILTGGKNLLVKDPAGTRIKEINSVYVLFETDILVTEK